MTTKEYEVPESLDGTRLDRAAAQLAEGLSRARLKKAIEAGAVRVNGRHRDKGALVSKGDVIAIDTGDIADANAPAIPSPDLPLVVCFEGKGVVVVDKRAGQPTAPLRPSETDTLANALVARYPSMQGVGYSPREPGLVHRLDTDTSGLVIAARSAEAAETLLGALKDERIEKRYLLVCSEDGLPDAGQIDFPIANHPKDQKRVYACIHPRDVMRNSPRPASTSYDVVRRSGKRALVEVKVSRALRHQIRVHFAAIDHPLVGDVLYGGEAVEGLGRHALHASRVAFAGGPGVDAFDVTCDLPAELARLLE